jgi:hypothetical protein
MKPVLMLPLALTGLVLLPSNAVAQSRDFPYRDVIVGALFTPSGDPSVDTGRGVLAVAGVSPVRGAFATVAVETRRNRFVAEGDRGTFQARALVATAGGYLPVARRFHLPAGAGLRRETYTVHVQGDTQRLASGGWHAMAGARIHATRQIELSLETQHLAFRDARIGTAWAHSVTTMVPAIPPCRVRGRPARGGT